MAKAKINNRLLDARPDRLDVRDFEYRPPLRSLPPAYPDDDLLKRLFPQYAKDAMVLDQGHEGACTGFGLAAVINYLRWMRASLAADAAGKRTFTAPSKVSERMLYHLARFYDEWPGEDYEGSSCRGAMKGWHRHGVCEARLWPYRNAKKDVVFVEPAAGWDLNATQCPLGVYYRVDKRSVVDMQAAIYQVGAIYVSGNVHKGWFPAKWKTKDGIACIEVPRKGGVTGGHAYCLVGYNRFGFIVQNSWGPSWGTHGFAILPYEDWVEHGMDAWATVLGAPIERAKAPHYHVQAALATSASSAVPAGAGLKAERAPLPPVSAAVSPWDTDRAYRHTVVMGNNGALINRNMHRETLAAFEHIVVEEPRKALTGPRKAIAIYAHGGLNAEEESIGRIRVMAPYFAANGVYPLFLTWKTGVLESIKGIVGDVKQGIEPQGAWRDLWDSVRHAAGEARDRAVEAAAEQFAVKALWIQMKQNAAAAGTRPQPISPVGAAPTRVPATLVLLAQAVARLQAAVPGAEIHLVGHSAGAILHGHFLDACADAGVSIATCTLYAPACTVQFAVDHYRAAVEKGTLRKTGLYVDLLSDERELADAVGPYGKSLLYLVSRALESHHKTPILGMEHAWRSAKRSTWADDAGIREGLSDWQSFWGEGKGLSVVTEAQISNGAEKTASTHGSFDNDVEVLTRTIERMTGKSLKHPVERLIF